MSYTVPNAFASQSGNVPASQLDANNAALVAAVNNAFLAGTIAARPAPDGVGNGRYYFATDTGTLYRDNGSSWVQVAAPAASSLTGEMKMWTGVAAPAGWLLCQGQAVSRATYSALFTVMSTTFGAGDGTTTFNVPDMRGRVPVGAGSGVGGGIQGNGLPAGGNLLGTVSVGFWQGEETHLLTANESGSRAHTHASPGGNFITDGGSGLGIGAGANVFAAGSQVQNNSAASAISPHENRQPSMGVNFIVKT